MELDAEKATYVGIFAALLLVEMRLLRRELKLAIAAFIERSRIRDRRRARRESAPPPSYRRDVPQRDEWPEDESTDIQVLMERERERERTRRKTDRHRRPGNRPPRPGTHHDH